MIVTVTPNIAIDRTYLVERASLGQVHKVPTVIAKVGGKGVNVSRVLKDLGQESRVTGLFGAAGAREAAAELNADGFRCAIYPVAGVARQTVTITEGSGTTTAFDEPGPTVTAQEWNGFEAHLTESFEQATCVVVAGSLPPGASPDALATILQAAASQGCLTVADARGTQLLMALRTGPQLVKLNRAELAESVERACESDADVVDAVQELHRRGAARVLVTLGSDGAIGFDGSDLWRIRHPPRSGNPIGAGDAFTAGFVRVLAANGYFVDALKAGAAAALASLNSPTAGHVEVADVDVALADVVIEPIIPTRNTI